MAKNNDYSNEVASIPDPEPNVNERPSPSTQKHIVQLCEKIAMCSIQASSMTNMSEGEVLNIVSRHMQSFMDINIMKQQLEYAQNNLQKKLITVLF